VTLVTTLSLLVPLSAAAPASADVDSPPAFAPVSATSAQQALRNARAAMAGTPQRTSPTLALRDLALSLQALRGRQLTEAEQLLARPNEGRRGGDGFAAWTTPEAPASKLGLGCSTDPSTPVCVHWTEQGTDSPNGGDRDADGVPNWVEVTLTEMERVWDYEVNTLGFRRPMTDQRGSIDNEGPDSTYLDVYLSDIGSRYYGYCAVDDTRNRSNYRWKDRSGYCVLDDDYDSNQFREHTPRENLQVTAAHEFFHAVQFAYDAGEDLWFMESSATWMEDEAYTDVNDNRQYLSASQFQNPRRSLDHNRSMSVYGGWGFLRFLSERFGVDVIRKAWGRADGARGGRDDYSLQALRGAVSSSGGNFDRALGAFGLALNAPARFLSEGRFFPSATVDRFRLDRERPSLPAQRYTLNHLAYAPVALQPGRLKRQARLQITVNAPNRRTHPEVWVMVVRQDRVTVDRVRLDRRGGGSVGVRFGGDVKRVVISLGNVSTQFRRCYSRSTPYSCKGGIPVADGLRFSFSAELG
jgi:hypothetical protein